MEMQRAIREFQAEYLPACGRLRRASLPGPGLHVSRGDEDIAGPGDRDGPRSAGAGDRLHQPGRPGARHPAPGGRGDDALRRAQAIRRAAGGTPGGGILSPWRIAVDVSLLAAPDLGDPDVVGPVATGPPGPSPHPLEGRCVDRLGLDRDLHPGVPAAEAGAPGLGARGRPRVVNQVMNQVRDLRVTEVAPDGSIRMSAGASRRRCRSSPCRPWQASPSSTSHAHRECLDVSITSPRSVAMERDQRLLLTGVAPGMTTLRLRLPCTGERDPPPDASSWSSIRRSSVTCRWSSSTTSAAAGRRRSPAGSTTTRGRSTTPRA